MTSGRCLLFALSCGERKGRFNHGQDYAPTNVQLSPRMEGGAGQTLFVFPGFQCEAAKKTSIQQRQKRPQYLANRQGQTGREEGRRRMDRLGRMELFWRERMGRGSGLILEMLNTCFGMGRVSFVPRPGGDVERRGVVADGAGLVVPIRCVEGRGRRETGLVRRGGRGRGEGCPEKRAMWDLLT